MNNIYIENKNHYDIFDHDFFESITNDMMKLLKYKYPVEINLIICDKSTIQKLNKEHRSIDKATDVLSFPLHLDVNIIKSCGFNTLGDIYICDSIIREVAIKEQRTIEREYAYMYLHSVLHLMGYDHIEKNEEKEMHEYIEEILKKKCIIN